MARAYLFNVGEMQFAPTANCPLASQKGMMIVDKNHSPNLTNAIEKWERGLDPWHRDAFPDEFKYRLQDTGKRKEGWFGLDWCGNAIVFIPDGLIMKK